MESQQNNKFNIVLCEIFNPLIHGYDERSSAEILTHYLVCYKFNNLNNNITLKYIYKIIKLIKNNIKKYRSLLNHPIIQNYNNILQNDNYIKVEIGECFYLEGGECVTILKTFWLRIIQRTWKKVYSERKKTISLRLNTKNILYRSIHGRWPEGCFYLPDINGLLHK
jgi:hypothetical protein